MPDRVDPLTSRSSADIPEARPGSTASAMEQECPKQDKAVELTRVTVTFNTAPGPLTAVNDVSLSVHAGGEALGIVGESGSGKSVLARTMMNLHGPEATVSGSVRVLGRDPSTLSAKERRHFWGVDVAMVFQDPMTSLNPTKRVGVQLSEGLRYHRGLSARAAEAVALSLLDQVHIPDARRRLRQYPHELSGGMRQRVVIAMALACEPKLLIADEPTTALDATVQRQILDLLDELRRQRRMAMVLITHDLEVVEGRTDKVIVMYGGRIMEQGLTRALYSEPQHPYTRALLRSVPRFDHAPHTRLEVIGGRPPNPLAHQQGCRFVGRCPRASDICAAEAPGLRGATADHESACFHPLNGDSAPTSDSVARETTDVARSFDGGRE
jgi:peptide/nickel transport system ATP-binding protein